MYRRYKLLVPGIIIYALFMALPGCSVSKRGDYANTSQWEQEYRREYANQLNYNEKRIHELKDSRDWERISVIEERNNKMKRKLESFKGNSRNEWDSFKRGFNREMRKVEKGIKRLR